MPTGGNEKTLLKNTHFIELFVLETYDIDVIWM